VRDYAGQRLISQPEALPSTNDRQAEPVEPVVARIRRSPGAIELNIAEGPCPPQQARRTESTKSRPASLLAALSIEPKVFGRTGAGAG
jgi:hypothetical protein